MSALSPRRKTERCPSSAGWGIVPVAIVAALLCFGRTSAEGDLRQPETLPFDAMTTDRAWFDLSIGYRNLDDSQASPAADDLFFAGRLAWAVHPNVELGLSAIHVSRDFDDPGLGSASGFGDTLAWAKYRFPSAGNGVVSVGALAFVPTGDEKDFLGSGNFDGGVFAAGGVRTRGEGFVQAHVGARTNGDPDPALSSQSGKTSILAGFGGSFPAASGVEVFATFSLETARFEGADTLAALSGGGRWSLGNAWRFQVLAGVGLTDPAPRLSLAAGVVYAP